MRAALLVLLVACGDSGPSCEQMVDHVIAVTKQTTGKEPSADIGDRATQIKKCQDRKIPADTRTCVASAPSLSAIADCYLAAARGTPRP